MQALDSRTTSPAAATAPTRPSRWRVARALGALLIVLGVLALADAGATLVWQEPLTSLYARLQQDKLGDRLAELDDVPIGPIERHVLARQPTPRRRLNFGARLLERRTHAGDPVARLRIPRIDLSAVVVQGTAGGDLARGPGHYPKTPLPGARGTVAIAGHRTTFGAWFRHVDRLSPGDPIELGMPYGTFRYRVERTQIVPANALWITRKVSYDRLVLSACHPLYSASKRIVVFARLVGAQPRTGTA